VGLDLLTVLSELLFALRHLLKTLLPEDLDALGDLFVQVPAQRP
jgi:hypothetical protein